MKKKSIEIKVWGILFTVSVVLLHLAIRIYAGDDVNYFNHALEGSSISEFVEFRYTRWTSRIIVELILVFVARNILLWKICNVLMYVLLVYSLYKISKVSSGIIFGLVLLYPIVDMASAGWIATSVNYFWPLALGTYSFVAVEKIVSGKKVKIYEVILSIIAEIIATNVEQYVVLHILCLGIVLAYLLSMKDYTKNKFVFLAIHFMVSFANLLFIITCPGNEERKIQEMEHRMKDFNNLSIFDKIISGYNTTISGFLNQYCLLFLIFVVILFACVIKKSSNDMNRYWIVSISAVSFILAMVVSIGTLFRNSYFTRISEILAQGTIINAGNWNKWINYVVFMLYAFFTISVILSIIYIFDDVFLGVIYGFLFFCAVLVRVVMGFSPTLYASEQRTFCFSYGVVLYILIMVLKEGKSLFKIKEIKHFEGLLFGISCVFVLEMLTRICEMY